MDISAYAALRVAAGWSGPAIAVALGLAVPVQLLASETADGSSDDQNGKASRAQAAIVDADTVVVTGTRRSGRTIAESSVPIDVVTARSLETVASGDLNDKLARLVPSYQVQRNTIANGNIFFRAATLRNLSPDHTLVLVDGKRRHRSAFVDVTQLGAQAVDISQIPTIALQRVEVLRDGASAQYGSDAIAGVINLIPDSEVGIRGYVQGGQYYAGDGENYQAGINAGFPLADRGTLNLSLEYDDAARTSRSRQALGAQALADNGGVYGDADFYRENLRNPVQRIGQPQRESYRSFLNLTYDLSDSTQLYAFGSYSRAEGQNDFIWRNPETSAYFNPLPIWGNWTLRSVFPGGFTPDFGMTTRDSDMVTGIKGAINDGLTWDFSTRYGRNFIRYSINDTINASLGPDSPTRFDAGTKTQTEYGANLDFVYQPGLDFSLPLTIAFGTEFRKEKYASGIGDEASYALGPGATYGYPGGANGFFGTDPTQAGSFSRHSVAAYVDVEAELTDRWEAGAAARYENYSDAGSSVTGKLSSRFVVTERIALRGAVSTGFRAPTPGQANLTNTSQRPSPDGLSILSQGTIPSIHPVAQLRGGKALDPERSVNLSTGVTVAFSPRSNLSVDYYNIRVKDRLGLSTNFALTAEERSQLVASGITLAQGLDTFNFYVNGFTTRTQGVDVIYSQQFEFDGGTRLGTTALYNYNRTRVVQAEEGVVSPLLRQSLQQRLPQHKAALTFDLTRGRFEATLRGTWYSAWTQPFFDAVEINQRFGAEAFIDASVSYAVTPRIKLTLGAENLLDNYPEQETLLASLGAKYPLYRPYEADGGRWYLRADWNF